MIEFSSIASSFHEFQIALRGAKKGVESENDLWRMRKFGYVKAYNQAKLCIVIELNMTAQQAQNVYLLFHRIPVIFPNSESADVRTESNTLGAKDASSWLYREANTVFVVGKSRHSSNEVVTAGIPIPSRKWLLRCNGDLKLLGETVEPVGIEVSESVAPGKISFESSFSQMFPGDVDCLIERITQVEQRPNSRFLEAAKRYTPNDLDLEMIDMSCRIDISDKGLVFAIEEPEKLGPIVINIGFCPVDRLLGRPEVRNIYCIHD